MFEITAGIEPVTFGLEFRRCSPTELRDRCVLNSLWRIWQDLLHSGLQPNALQVLLLQQRIELSAFKLISPESAPSRWSMRRMRESNPPLFVDSGV